MRVIIGENLYDLEGDLMGEPGDEFEVIGTEDDGSVWIRCGDREVCLKRGQFSEDEWGESI
jgi:hypothetical protein